MRNNVSENYSKFGYPPLKLFFSPVLDRELWRISIYRAQTNYMIGAPTYLGPVQRPDAGMFGVNTEGGPDVTSRIVTSRVRELK